VPAAPRDGVLAAGGRVLGDATALTTPLTPHGPAARRRRFLRAVGGAALVPVVLVVLVLASDVPVWLAVLGLLVPLAGVLLAQDRYDGLGHALTRDHLVVRSGSLQGRRDALQRSGIIGWNLRQTWFQRRAGLVTLTATTAAGKQAYRAVDVPEHVAVALADAAVPGLLTPFLA
jgi:putative membrane protein